MRYIEARRAHDRIHLMKFAVDCADPSSFDPIDMVCD